MNKDQVKGRAKQAKGKMEEVAGKALDDKNLEKSGALKKTLGKARSDFGDFKADLKDKK